MLENLVPHILYITFNRIYYTKKTLPILLDSCKHPFILRIVDNGSTDGTVEYLKKLTHPRIEKIIYNRTNRGLVNPTKKFWKESNAELVGKIDNDILVPQNWVEKLIDAHLKIPKLGVCGYCHFHEGDFNNDAVRQKVEKINGINFRRQPWIGGNYLMKSHHIKIFPGYIKSRKLIKKRTFHGFTKYQIKLSEKGLIHGYLCDEKKNLLLWEHIDDPRNKNFQLNSNYPNRLINENIIEWYKQDATNLLEKYQSFK